jgi:hypothetical protein
MSIEPEHEPGAERGWHFRKEIQVGHLLTTLVIAISVAGYVSAIERRLAMVEQDQKVLHETDELQRNQHIESERLMRVQLDKIDSKLDRMIESRIK